jgi:CDP-paratose 2-epimerase
LDKTTAGHHFVNILITGVCGFVGSTLAESLLERVEGIQVTGIDNLMRPGAETNRLRLERQGVKFIPGDLRAASDMTGLPACDWVLMLLQIRAGSPAPQARELAGGFLEHNVTALGNVLEYCRESKAGLLLLSSSRVYSIAAMTSIPLLVQVESFNLDATGPLPIGLSAQGIGVEFPTTAPISLYGATKLASEIMAVEYVSVFDFPDMGHALRCARGRRAVWHTQSGHFRLLGKRSSTPPADCLHGFQGKGYQARDVSIPAMLRRSW